MSGPNQYEPYPQEPYPATQRYPATPPYPSSQPAVPVPMAYVATPATDQQPQNTAVMVVAWVVTVLTGLYMLPWAIAATRGKSNQWAVFAVSLLLGWTVVGWIVALVMACTAHRMVGSAAMMGVTPMAALPAPVPAGWYPNPTGAGRRYWDGYRWTEHYS